MYVQYLQVLGKLCVISISDPSRREASVTLFKSFLFFGGASTLRLMLTGCGSKYRGARGQLLTRGPEADETKTMTVTLPHRV